MQFIKFKQKLKDFIVFNLEDIRKLDDNFDLRRLNEWQQKHYIKMVRNGYYVFSDLEVNEPVLFIIANKIYDPSYVSLEMALGHYNLIPEGVYGITSVTSEKTNRFKTGLGKFIYRHIKPELLFGYKLIEYQNHRYKIAEIEKAVLDHFYLNANLKNKSDFEGLRFNAEEFTRLSDMNKLKKYLKEYGNKSLENRVENFIKFLRNA